MNACPPWSVKVLALVRQEGGLVHAIPTIPKYQYYICEFLLPFTVDFGLSTYFYLGNNFGNLQSWTLKLANLPKHLLAELCIYHVLDNCVKSIEGNMDHFIHFLFTFHLKVLEFLLRSDSIDIFESSIKQQYRSCLDWLTMESPIWNNMI